MIRAKTTLIVGGVVFLIYAFPGYMSTDSAFQIVEARTHHFTNAHPPIMAAEWAVLDAIVSGPLLMLLAQATLFAAGLYRIFARLVPSTYAALIAVALWLFPPVQTVMGVIWKDSQMAAYLLFGLSMLGFERRSIRLAGLGLITIGCAMRHNALAAAVPLVGLLFEWRPGLTWWRRYAISGTAAVAVVLGAAGINRVLTIEHRSWTPAFGDIVGVLQFTGPRSDEELLQLLHGTPLVVKHGIQAHARRIYWSRNSYQVTRGPDRLFDDPTTAEQWAALDRAWHDLIASDWHAYAESRVASFREVLGLSSAQLMAPVWNDFIERPDHMDWCEHAATWSWLQYKLGRIYTWLAVETPLFRPYVYAVLAVILLAGMLMGPGVGLVRDRTAIALLASGLVYEASLLPASGAPDYRYSHWMITTTCAALAIAIIRRRGRSAM